MFLFFRSTHDRCSTVAVELGQVSPSLRFIKSRSRLLASILLQVCQVWRKSLGSGDTALTLAQYLAEARKVGQCDPFLHKSKKSFFFPLKF